LFDKYVPDTIFEMKKSYRHITPLSTMNFVTTLTNILEGVLKPENLSNKADQALFEMYFVFAAIWAFGGALVEKDGIDYRRNFDKWWKQTWTTVKLPGALLKRQDSGCQMTRCRCSQAVQTLQDTKPAAATLLSKGADV
jgi:dynein heavy chain